MNSVAKAWTGLLAVLATIFLFVFLVFPDALFARNINEYKDTISDSSPMRASNHTLSFKIGTDVSPGGYFEVTMPDGFEILSTSTFVAERNVELLVGGVPRVSDTTLGPGVDMAEILPGSPGVIRYTLNPSSGIAAGSQLVLKIGNNTSESLEFSETFATTTGTTTIEK